jgi:hypothetical protein
LTYYALRVCPRAESSTWWASARLAFPFAPPAIRAILTGRTRVELSAEEARQALEWARGLDGWDSGSYTPLYVVPVGP